ncbi:putative defense protein 3 [Strongylocentrotus purpuratus]|uniref:Reelin domain-containing protein n=1 Tax=Strongylocentrotus purpuratus TaxID=7668 RepID=A0A7M7MZA9_STRPU|nr:putative defense protein 3 [Strongylocentrotus purpuratus]
MSYFWSLAFLAAVPLVMAFPTGAPAGACVNLTPGHRYNASVIFPPQTGPSPYVLNVSKNMYTPSEELTVSVTGGSFKGILLQARLADDTLVGTFSDPPTNTKLVKCTGPGDSVTHTSTTPKEAGTSFTWTAPGSDVGNVIFTATFVLEYDEFWVKVTSQEIPSTDIDECSVNDPAPCDTKNGACENSAGSYSCSCNAGYKLSTADGFTCNGAPWVTVNSALIISLLCMVFVATKQ